RGKDEKYKVRMPKLRAVRKLRDVSKSIDDVERSFLKFKKSSEEKSKKMEKEEKLSRETFMHDKELRVLARATAECSVPGRRRGDLPVTAGEQLDVMDSGQGHTIICRNRQGRCECVISWFMKSP
ncbi:FYB2 protein, partial [Malurus elegans]|nr:FYB2 protein [Malurus elegans]